MLVSGGIVNSAMASNPPLNEESISAKITDQISEQLPLVIASEERQR
jgi:uncharacterized protein YneF (UPF0154 family)